jgi:hypothetical protein
MFEDDEAIVARSVRALVARFPWMPEPLLRTYAEQALASFSDATVRTYLSILVGRRARAAIVAAAEPQPIGVPSGVRRLRPTLPVVAA